MKKKKGLGAKQKMHDVANPKLNDFLAKSTISLCVVIDWSPSLFLSSSPFQIRPPCWSPSATLSSLRALQRRHRRCPRCQTWQTLSPESPSPPSATQSSKKKQKQRRKFQTGWTTHDEKIRKETKGKQGSLLNIPERCSEHLAGARVVTTHPCTMCRATSGYMWAVFVQNTPP